MKKGLSPSYLNISNLPEKAAKLKKILSSCTLCGFRCGINRFNESTGRCRSGYLPKIASATLHHGEELPISGHRGSGTIFFSGCSLECLFCQNYPISQLGNGKELTIEELAECMLGLQERGAHNINLVTPTHFVPQIIESLCRAVEKGLHIPIVYNSSGYDSINVLNLLEGVVDIYLPDMKYGNDENAWKYSHARDYVSVNRDAVREMYRQTGELVLDKDGVARRGLLIRHLILPGGISGTEQVLAFIARLSNTIPVSLMGQYFPAYKAVSIPELNRKITVDEYNKAARLLHYYGLENGWLQSI